ncbi:MAG: hypothetical protein A2X19_10790 [Bacteroidetes bacterium GWE2_39_28]|nr:MAG: hypothetical protein A2X19_10790 [Bacteroidetes bacterium GWE2_39_28]OFY13515.1 MAG: hypothetical protein A2X16_07590 [Bacteroidetes bacterium GWF2_39_10]OFZ06685.1 MAG: hypothetical protein A2322_06840 [Bacteroidetes bacterium RIFOXYB2_FULL_39_7]OFZ11676.1 MAG: hypothetical protein A2465_05595 [Bacteroidetes bacterium RIFOXYC2_FULL_39_11]HCT94849.1 NUDIX hydrolase [Rikenellaceae bacterium]
MDGKFTYDYPRAALTSDCVVFGFDGETLNILLVQRGAEPFKDNWSLPGGFLRMDETIEECAERELKEETGISGVFMRQIKTFSSIDRDPRGRVITVAFYALINPYLFNRVKVTGGEDITDAGWFPIESVLADASLAFDHHEIISEAIEKLKHEIRHYPIAFELLDKYFTIKQLQTVYESILNTKFDRGNFQKKMVGRSENVTVVKKGTKSRKEQRKNTGVLIDSGEVVSGVKHKPAKIYSFDRTRFERLVKKADFTFDF